MHTPSLLSGSSQVEIKLGDRSYPILIGEALLGDPSTYAGLPRAAQALIVSNTTVEPLYGASLQSAIKPHFSAVHRLSLPDGEEHKNWEQLNRVFECPAGKCL